MLSRLAVAALAFCALAPAAQAAPAISVSSAAAGDLSKLPATVTHRLTLTAGATPETLGIATAGPMHVSGDATGVMSTAVGSPTMTCGTKWERFHAAYGERSTFQLHLTIPAGGTAVVDTAVTFQQAPWATDSLDADWDITPTGGTEFSVVSRAPFYTGKSGVELDFTLHRRARGAYGVSG